MLYFRVDFKGKGDVSKIPDSSSDEYDEEYELKKIANKLVVAGTSQEKDDKKEEKNVSRTTCRLQGVRIDTREEEVDSENDRLTDVNNAIVRQNQPSDDICIEMTDYDRNASSNASNLCTALENEHIEHKNETVNRRVKKHSNRCLKCLNVVKLSTFDNSLVPGDHIKIRGRLPVLRQLYYHHAIVTEVNNISSDGHTAEITVIDVNQKRKGPSCIARCMQFETHPLEVNGETAIRCDQVERVEYTTQFNDQIKTLHIAENYVIKRSYCCLFNNCENAVTACKSAKLRTDRKLKLSKSLSIQHFRFIHKIMIFCSIFVSALNSLRVLWEDLTLSESLSSDSSSSGDDSSSGGGESIFLIFGFSLFLLTYGTCLYYKRNILLCSRCGISLIFFFLALLAHTTILLLFFSNYITRLLATIVNPVVAVGCMFSFYIMYVVLLCCLME